MKMKMKNKNQNKNLNKVKKAVPRKESFYDTSLIQGGKNQIEYIGSLWTIYVSSSLYIDIMNFTRIISNHEWAGLIGGRYDIEERTIYLDKLFIGKHEATSGEVELENEEWYEPFEAIEEDGLEYIAWHHSHHNLPKIGLSPSSTDNNTLMEMYEKELEYDQEGKPFVIATRSHAKLGLRIDLIDTFFHFKQFDAEYEVYQDDERSPLTLGKVKEIIDDKIYITTYQSTYQNNKVNHHSTHTPTYYGHFGTWEFDEDELVDNRFSNININNNNDDESSQLDKEILEFLNMSNEEWKAQSDQEKERLRSNYQIYKDYINHVE